MDEIAAFLEMIRERPDDQTARLVFADWLEDRGDPRADYVRRSHDWYVTASAAVESPSLEACQAVDVRSRDAKLCYFRLARSVLPSIRYCNGLSTLCGIMDGLSIFASPNCLKRFNWDHARHLGRLELMTYEGSTAPDDLGLPLLPCLRNLTLVVVPRYHMPGQEPTYWPISPLLTPSFHSPALQSVQELTLGSPRDLAHTLAWAATVTTSSILSPTRVRLPASNGQREPIPWDVLRAFEQSPLGALVPRVDYDVIRAETDAPQSATTSSAFFTVRYDGQARTWHHLADHSELVHRVRTVFEELRLKRVRPEQVANDAEPDESGIPRSDRPAGWKWREERRLKQRRRQGPD